MALLSDTQQGVSCLLVDAAGPDERRVQLLGVVGGQYDYPVGTVHHAVKHIQRAGLPPSALCILSP